jgi:hypothetical protein
MRAARDEAGEVRHVDQQVRADLVGDGAERGEVPMARIGGPAGDDHLRLVLVGEAADLVDIDALVLSPDVIRHGLEPLCRSC